MAAFERLLADRYEIGRRIGRGGMAEVYLGTDTRLGRQVAVKLLNTEMSNEPAFRQRFRQEAQASARMTHPTIVRVFDAGEDTFTRPDGRELIVPYIVMEYVPGRQLREIMGDGPLPNDRIRLYMDGVLTALEYSHRAGIAHRDIKPGNVMVTPDDEIKVMDFGIARAISDTAGTIAQTTAILGTASYFSPEQARGEQVDGRSDLYSAGIMLYEMLAGRVPFQGDNAVSVAFQHVTEPPTPPSQINPNVTPELEAVVMHALAKNREHRYQTAAEFRRDLDLALSGRKPVALGKAEAADVLATQVIGTVPTATAATVTLTAPVTQQNQVATVDEDEVDEPEIDERPATPWLWASALLVVALLAGLGWWVFSLPNDDPDLEAGITVPDVAGQSFEQANAAVIQAGLIPERAEEASDSVPKGSVIRTDPLPGTKVDEGFRVRLYVSTGPAKVPLPNLAGMDRERAEEVLKSNGLALGSIREEDSPTLPEGVVISTDPAAGESVAPGSRVNLVLSTGKVTVPDLRGESTEDASKILQDLGLRALVEEDDECEATEGDPIVGQSVAPGPVEQSSTVTLTYCTGEKPQPTFGGRSPGPTSSPTSTSSE